MTGGDPWKQIEQLLREHSTGKPERFKRHDIYRLKNGKIYVMPCSPERNSRSGLNNLLTLKRLLDLLPADRGQPGERRERRYRDHTERIETYADSGAHSNITTSMRHATNKRLVADEDFDTLMRLQGVKKL